MVDDSTESLKPLELKPDINVIGQLSYWNRSLYRRPINPLWRRGMPRIWQGTGTSSRGLQFQNFLKFIDGDINSAFVDVILPAGEVFYTLDMGAPIPVERFVVVPPMGIDPGTQIPYRPFWSFEGYGLTASNNEQLVNTMEPEFRASYTYLGQVFPIAGFAKRASPLDIILAEEEQNFASVIDVAFPLQHLRFFRFRPFPDGEPDFTLGSSPQAGPPLGSGYYSRFAIAELEIYGRGIVPFATWESRVIDLGSVANVANIVFATSARRVGEDEGVADPDVPATAKVILKSGVDDSPTVYYSFDELGQAIEVELAEYKLLKPRRSTGDPFALGWQGPIVDDVDNWSFWTAPLREGGDQPRVPPGRYVKIQVQFETESLWESMHLDSLALEISPLLAESLVGEVAVADDLHPQDNLAQLVAGVPTELVCDIAAVFSEQDQGGFDAIRVSLPGQGSFGGLEMDDPFHATAPDSVVQQPDGFVVYLPQPVHPSGSKQLRIRFQTTLYSAAGELGIELFSRAAPDANQMVVGGDASTEITSNQLRMVAASSMPRGSLAEMIVEPAAFTPQGDGVNDKVHIGYTLFKILGKVEVEVAILRLHGQLVQRSKYRGQKAGRHTVAWDGRDQVGQLVGPGLYLVKLSFCSDTQCENLIRTVAVVY